jgi:hypothetical protein
VCCTDLQATLALKVVQALAGPSNLFLSFSTSFFHPLCYVSRQRRRGVKLGAQHLGPEKLGLVGCAQLSVCVVLKLCARVACSSEEALEALVEAGQIARTFVTCTNQRGGCDGEGFLK